MKKKIYYFQKNGFVILRNIIKKKQLEILFNEVEIIKKKAIKTKNKRYFHFTSNNKINTIHNIQKFYKSKILTELSKNHSIQKFLKIILSKNIHIRNLEFFLKPKKTGMASPLHQDNYFWNIIDSKAVNVWIALSNANKRNGGVFYLKESHKKGIINHVPSFMKGTSQKIPEHKIKKNNFKKFFPNLKQGDCVIHHCEVIHGSERNLSNFDRIGIAISFKNKSSKINLLNKKIYERKVKENLNKLYS